MRQGSAGNQSRDGVARTRARIKGTSLYVRTEPAYDGQSNGRRVRNWNPTSGSINMLLGALQQQRNRSRDLARKVPWISGGIEALVANIVGEGIRPLSRAPKKDFREGTQIVWSDWCNEADAHGVLDFYGLQAQAVRAMIEGGECFIRMRDRETSDGLIVPMQLQVLEAEYVPVEKNELLSNGNKIVCGIEFDKLGRRVAYHMYRQHPGEAWYESGNGGRTTTRVSADQVIHLYNPRRPGQVRGIPWLSPVMLRTRDLLEYEDAELVRKKTTAMYAGFITRPDPEDNILNEDAEEEGAEEEGVAITTLEPGTMQLLEPGEEVEFSSPADVGGNYEPYLKFQLRALSTGLGCTYEQMTGDLKEVNFSSIRAGLMEFQRRARIIQRLVIFQLCRPVWHKWMATAILVGTLQAENFAYQPHEHRRVIWQPPGWQYVNPSQEVAATKAMIRSGLKSRSKAVAETGEDASEVDRQLAEDQARADELGLVLDSDPRQTTNSGGVAEHDAEAQGTDSSKSDKAGQDG